MNNYSDLPPDLWPRELHAGEPRGAVPDYNLPAERIKPPANLGDSIYLTRNLVARPVTITTTPVLIARSTYAWPYIILNPSTTVGLTTTVTGFSGVASTGDTTASVGVSGFEQQHLILNITAIGAATWDIYQQSYDSINAVWADSQMVFGGLTATGAYYAFPAAFGLGTDVRFRFDRTAGAGTLTCTISMILKNGVGGSLAGLSQAIYLGGPGVSTTNGFPLLEGQSLRLTIGEGVELYGVAATSINIRVFEL